MIPNAGEPRGMPAPDPDALLARPADVEPPEYEPDDIACALTLDARQAYAVMELVRDADEDFRSIGMEDTDDAKANRDVLRRLNEAGVVDPDE